MPAPQETFRARARNRLTRIARALKINLQPETAVVSASAPLTHSSSVAPELRIKRGPQLAKPFMRIPRTREVTLRKGALPLEGFQFFAHLSKVAQIAHDASLLPVQLRNAYSAVSVRFKVRVIHGGDSTDLPLPKRPIRFIERVMNASIPPRENLALLLSGGHPHNRIPVISPPLDLFQALLLFRREFFRSRACGRKHRFPCSVDLLLQGHGFRSRNLPLLPFRVTSRLGKNLTLRAAVGQNL
jgi:hypothetical protein